MKNKTLPKLIKKAFLLVAKYKKGDTKRVMDESLSTQSVMLWSIFLSKRRKLPMGLG